MRLRRAEKPLGSFFPDISIGCEGGSQAWDPRRSVRERASARWLGEVQCGSARRLVQTQQHLTILTVPREDSCYEAVQQKNHSVGFKKTLCQSQSVYCNAGYFSECL